MSTPIDTSITYRNVNFSIEPQTWKWARIIAIHNQKTISSLIRIAVQEELDRIQEGYVPPNTFETSGLLPKGVKYHEAIIKIRFSVWKRIGYAAVDFQETPAIFIRRALRTYLVRQGVDITKPPLMQEELTPPGDEE